jgi:hypothetical protein
MKKGTPIAVFTTAIQMSVALLCHAQDYDFSGTFTNLFMDAFSDGDYTFVQTCGRMIAHNGNTIGADANRGYFLKTGLPTSSQSWSLSAKLTIPYPAEGMTGGNPSADAYAEVGIGCLFGQNHFGGGLQVEPPWASKRLVLSEISTEGDEVFDTQGDSPYTEESATVTMRYNSTNKVLQFYANGKMLLDLDIVADGQHHSPRELNWGMKADSVFQIAFFANSENYAISPHVPLQLDNFSFHIDDQPPTRIPDLAINRKAVELECTGIPGQIYEIQVSDDFNNWFTIQTYFGTGGLVRIPVSADSDRLFYRIKP